MEPWEAQRWVVLYKAAMIEVDLSRLPERIPNTEVWPALQGRCAFLLTPGLVLFGTRHCFLYCGSVRSLPYCRVRIPKRILIADEHELRQRGVRSSLESNPDWEVCGEAVDGRAAVAKAAELHPDLAPAAQVRANQLGIRVHHAPGPHVARSAALLCSGTFSWPLCSRMTTLHRICTRRTLSARAAALSWAAHTIPRSRIGGGGAVFMVVSLNCRPCSLSLIH